MLSELLQIQVRGVRPPSNLFLAPHDPDFCATPRQSFHSFIDLIRVARTILTNPSLSTFHHPPMARILMLALLARLIPTYRTKPPFSPLVPLILIACTVRTQPLLTTARRPPTIRDLVCALLARPIPAYGANRSLSPAPSTKPSWGARGRTSIAAVVVWVPLNILVMILVRLSFDCLKTASVRKVGAIGGRAYEFEAVRALPMPLDPA